MKYKEEIPRGGREEEMEEVRGDWEGGGGLFVRWILFVGGGNKLKRFPFV